MNLNNITEKLELAEMVQNNALLASSAGIWQLNLTTDNVIWDNRMLEIFEFDEDYFKNSYHGFEELILPEYHEEIRAKLLACQTGIAPFCSVYKVKSKNSKGYKTVLGKGNIVIEEDETRMMHGICVEILE
jgi:hypothetical protein